MLNDAQTPQPLPNIQPNPNQYSKRFNNSRNPIGASRDAIGEDCPLFGGDCEPREIDCAAFRAYR